MQKNFVIQTVIMLVHLGQHPFQATHTPDLGTTTDNSKSVSTATKCQTGTPWTPRYSTTSTTCHHCDTLLFKAILYLQLFTVGCNSMEKHHIQNKSDTVRCIGGRINANVSRQGHHNDSCNRKSDSDDLAHHNHTMVATDLHAS